MCVSPLVRFRLKYEPKTAPPCKEFQFNEFWYMRAKGEKDGFRIKSKKYLESFFESHGHYLAFMDSYCDYMEIPCGSCIECRKDYSRDWSVRCYHESLCHSQNAFLTLTLDDLANEKFNKIIERSCKNGTNIYCKNCSNGSRYYRYPIHYTLSKGLILWFIKRLRDYLYRNYGITVRYFGCGEYGSEDYTNRPHYHLILYGYNFPSVYKDGKLKYRTFFSHYSPKGIAMNISEELRHLWPFGYSYVEEVNLFACQYVAQYCCKKIKGFEDNNEFYDYYYGKVPEFLFMSKGNCQVNRCPYIDKIVDDKLNSLRNLYNPYCKNCNKTRGGLGYEWLLKNFNDVRKLGYIVINGQKFPIPDYYKKIIKLTDEKLYDKLSSDNIYYVNQQIIDHPDQNSTENNYKRKQIEYSKSRMFGQRNSIR